MNQRQFGFTFIEMIIAIVIVGVSVTPLLMVLGNLVDKTILPEVHNIATHLAERELERVTSQRYSAVVSQAQTTYGGSFSKYSYEVQVTSVPVALANDPTMIEYKQVRVIIRNSVVGAVQLTTLVTNHP